MTLGLVWAQTPAGVIGRGGVVPWHVPEDLAHFRQVTDGHPVVMGRTTWQSLPERFRPLPGRTNVVLSRDPTFAAAGALVAGSLESALALLSSPAPASDEARGADDEVWVIGGAAVYAEALAWADRLEVTEVNLDVGGDAHAPAVDPGVWTATLVGPWQTSRTGPRYRFGSYARTGGSPRRLAR